MRALLSDVKGREGSPRGGPVVVALFVMHVARGAVAGAMRAPTREFHRSEMMTRKHSAVTDAIGGMVAGAVATWLMGKATTALYQRESKRARRREDEARGGKTAYGVAAEKIARLANRQLSDEQRSRYGNDIHWALGITAGGIYGLLRPRVSAASAGRGLIFGSTFFLLMDELVTPAIGLTPGPRAFPWQTHARGLAGHLVYGMVADTALGTMQQRA
jgi:hypothetical protein